MKIGLDLRMIGGGSGIDRYITELSHEILKTDKQNSYVLFLRTLESAAQFQGSGAKVVIADIAHYSLAEQLKFPGILNREQLDLVHFPHFNVPLLYNRPFVVTIHDLTHTLFPGRKKSRIFHRLAYRAVFAHAVRAARKIIAVSESTKKQIMEFYRLPENKISVVYEGFNAQYKMLDKAESFARVAQKFGITKPYLLYVGVWRRYKNLPMLAKAFEKLKDRGVEVELVLAGEVDKFYPEIPQQIFDNKYAKEIKAPGRVSDEDLAELYNGSLMFVLPSLMEGFGLTALEAAACGVPVLCADIPTLREIMGQGAEYFDPHNADNMADVMQNLIENPLRQEELANAALRRANRFSWNQAAQETVKLYEEATV